MDTASNHGAPRAPDPYFKKRLAYQHHDHRFSFDVAHTLFSSHQVDTGSDLLLRTLAPPHQPQRILDLGCGCGILGIVLAHQCPNAHVFMLDRDLLAVRYACQNALLNQTPNTTVLGSVGLEHAPPGPYDLIVANIPAKVGDVALEMDFICAPATHLAANGAYWFVVVSGLNRLIPKLQARHGFRLKEMKKRSGHTVYCLRLPDSECVAN